MVHGTDDSTDDSTGGGKAYDLVDGMDPWKVHAMVYGKVHDSVDETATWTWRACLMVETMVTRRVFEKVYDLVDATDPWMERGMAASMVCRKANDLVDAMELPMSTDCVTVETTGMVPDLDDSTERKKVPVTVSMMDDETVQTSEKL